MTTIASALKFVQGAVAKKDPLPILTHFSIKDNRVKGYNGSITISSPIPLPMDCQPKAVTFVKAIQACDETVHLALTPAGRLTVKSGKFRVHVDCSPEPFPDVEPSGDFYDVMPGLIAALKVVEPLIAEDASRPWARSIMLKDGSLFATNNVALVQYWVGHELPGQICISHLVVNELIRIKEDPIKVQLDESSITFHYTDDRWVRTALVTLPWPDLEKVLSADANPEPIPDEFYSALETAAAFANADSDVWFTEHGVTTNLEGDEEGAAVTIPGWNTPIGWFNINVLRSLDGLMENADFSLYPRAVIFNGKEGALRGALIGKKDANYPPPPAG